MRHSLVLALTAAAALTACDAAKNEQDGSAMGGGGSGTISKATAGRLEFTVEVSGRHRTESADGGWDEMNKQRLFKGAAQMQRTFLSAFDPVDPEAAARLQQGGADAGALMAQGFKDGPYEVWQSMTCTGETTVEDKGQNYNPHDPGFNKPVLTDVKESGRWSSASDGGGAGCAVQMVINRQGETVSMSINPAPDRMGVQQTFGPRTPNTVQIAPFGWTSVGKTGRDINFVGAKSRFAGDRIEGAWEASGGEPHDIRNNAVHQREKQSVATKTKVSWRLQMQ